MYVCSVSQSCLTLCDSTDCKPSRLLCPWDFPGKNTRVGSHFFIQGNLPDPRIEPASPALAGKFFTNEPPEKPVNNESSLKIYQFKSFSNLKDLSGYWRVVS